MRALVATDDSVLGTKVRELLAREGHTCASADVVLLDAAANRLARAPAELVVVVLSPDPQPALAVLREARAATQGRVLAVGPAAEPKLILRTLREGADQYVDQDELETELTAILTRLGADTEPRAELGRLVAVLAPSGGSGSSTIAVNLATVLARAHERCALFDLKLETGDLASLLDLKPTHSLAELCLHASRMDQVMFERSLVQHASGVCLLAAPPSVADVAAITPQGLRRALALARTCFPYVVVDLDHSFREEQLLVLRQADTIVVVFRLDFTSLRNARRTLEYLEAAGVSLERVRLVVNRYGQPRELPAAKAEEALSRKIFHYVPDDPKTVNRANNNGIPAVLDDPRAGVSQSLTRLAMSVNGQSKPH